MLAIWVPSCVNRPYAISTDVIIKGKCEKAYYIRSGTSSVVAKGEVLDQLRDLANRVPFDERPNPDITLKDISMVLLRDYLAKVNSKLEQSIFTQPLEQPLEQMDLMEGPIENRVLKNVAAMMFCEHPEKFFKYMQVDIVVFPKGVIRNPKNFTEKTFKGCVPHLIQQTMDYLRTHILYETVQKVSGQAEVNSFWNYPYDALEEAVVNALYHRDYSQYELVEITIEPDGIDILSCPGPDRSIPEKLEDNGSPRATFETTEDRLTFLIHIPIHPGCGDVVVLNGMDSNGQEMSNKMSNKEQERFGVIEKYLKENGFVVKSEVSSLLNVEDKTAQRLLAKAVELGLLRSEGQRKSTVYMLNKADD